MCNAYHAIADGIYELLVPYIQQPWSMQLKPPAASYIGTWWYIAICQRKRIEHNAQADPTLYPVLVYLILFTDDNIIIKHWDDYVTTIYEGEYANPNTIDEIVNMVKILVAV